MSIQVVMIFTFLTVFFFLYVVKVEREEFTKQIELIVDGIMTTQKGDPSSYISGPIPIPKEELEAVILGVLDETKRNQAVSDSPADGVIDGKNNNIEKKASIALMYVWGVLLLVILMFYIFGICTSMRHILIETIIVVVFVGIVEFVFLRVIAAKYISASPNQVRRELAQSIQGWIKDNGVLQ